MPAITVHTTWVQATESATVRDALTQVCGDKNLTVTALDLDKLENAYRAYVNDNLPAGFLLAGEDLIGPAGWDGDPITALVWAMPDDDQLTTMLIATTVAPPAAPVFVQCKNPDHDHTTLEDGQGGSLDVAAPARCFECGAPAHFDEGANGGWIHDDPEHPGCFVVGVLGDDGGTPCTF